ncbi:zinc ribbon domain-containing protein [Paraburkholderia sp. D15]|uniref:zinc ribbon domain-containing protein n=1 Tax=Paraburkholderia sp. D15 TaxID=2880218 RepID=UPI00247A6F48|nr:zinc ribbon domain-containing protein [Paraburkholderia sp. D15]WGS48079.1 zinc ribbon domain-containing protein [Paraburkholderia sp. D15]
MSYEFSSEGDRLNLPNPFRVENWFRFAAALLLFVGGLAALLLSRHNLAAHRGALAFLPLAMGVFLLGSGINYARIGMMQLRFYFGRGQPLGLAGEIPASNQDGVMNGAANLQERMRSGALWFEEPKGALNGLLYSLIPALIYAPVPIRRLAQSQFESGLALVATLLSFLIATIGFDSSSDRTWVALLFFGFAFFLLLKPMEQQGHQTTPLGPAGLIGLLLIAVFAPIVVPLMSAHLPDLSWLPLTTQTFALLLCAIVAVLLFFVALIRQTVVAPKTSMGSELATVSLNGQPKQLLDELERHMQRRWVEQIPNRRYARQTPDVTGQSGQFTGQLFEETQPLPREDMRRVDLKRAFTEPRYRWLVSLNAFGVALVALAVICLLWFAAEFSSAYGDDRSAVLGWATFGSAMLAVGAFCLRAGHMLWARFDFLSKLVWVQFDGNFQRSKMNLGSQFTDRVRTESDVVAVHDMSVRVWVAEIDSVTFGRDHRRMIVGMRGLPDEARELRTLLEQCAQQQTVVVAPTSQRDIEKIALSGSLNKVSDSGGAGLLPEKLRDALGGNAAAEHGTQTPAHTQTPAPSKPQCKACGETLEPGSRFCAHCGTAVG